MELDTSMNLSSNDKELQISNSAQAVRGAAFAVYDEENIYVGSGEQHAGMIAAAALRAFADQVVPEDYDPPRARGIMYVEIDEFIDGKCDHNEEVRYRLLAIAAELEGAR